MKDTLTYRLICEDGTVHEAFVEVVEPGFSTGRGPGWAGYMASDTPRGAAVKVAAHGGGKVGLGLPVIEVLAPGEVSRADLEADNATLRAELDDLRGRLSRTASRLADLERTGAALTYDAALAALRRGPVVSVCARCNEERARWCAGCGLCEATCCACTLGDEGSAA
jgi:hypothetical protein